jgi:O-antigen ligase
MTWILGISFLAGAAAWGYWWHRREPDWTKAALVCMLCTWWPAAVICPFFKDIRNPVLVALAALSFTWSRNERLAVRRWTLHPALISLLAVMAASVCWAVNFRDTALRAVGILLTFAFLWNLLRTAGLTRVARWVTSGLLFGSYTIVVLIAVGKESSAVASDGRYKLTDELVATGAAALCFWAFVRLFAEGMVQKGSRRILHLLLAAVAVFAMIRTGTRGTLVQLAAVLPLLFALRLPVRNVENLAFRYVFYGLVMLGLSAPLWASFGDETKSRYKQIFRIEESGGTTDTRTSLWQSAMEKAGERRWLGRGLGSSSFFTYQDEELKEINASEVDEKTPVHNEYLEIYYEFGLLGCVVFAWLAVTLCQNAVRIYLYDGPNAWAWRMFAVYAMAALVAGMTHGGLISTGHQDMLCMWMVYCCVLSFPFASAAIVERSGGRRDAGRFRAGRGRRAGSTRGPHESGTGGRPSDSKSASRNSPLAASSKPAPRSH